ncbi:MAG TPA: hypothetical protein VFM18_15310 [Methanosarcina sp.]|nr:hypothetical protein [Methanosarcina sp.]
MDSPARKLASSEESGRLMANPFKRMVAKTLRGVQSNKAIAGMTPCPTSPNYCVTNGRMKMNKEQLFQDMMHQATHDSALFRTYDDDYDVIDRDQVMRCLANLDGAILKFNQLAAFTNQRIEIDAIFTALTIMQKNLQKAVEHKAEQVMESKREMACFGGEE